MTRYQAISRAVPITVEKSRYQPLLTHNWYTTSDEIQRDLDIFMAFYNFRRTHQG